MPCWQWRCLCQGCGCCGDAPLLCLAAPSIRKPSTWLSCTVYHPPSLVLHLNDIVVRPLGAFTVRCLVAVVAERHLALEALHQCLPFVAALAVHWLDRDRNPRVLRPRALLVLLFVAWHAVVITALWTESAIAIHSCEWRAPSANRWAGIRRYLVAKR